MFEHVVMPIKPAPKHTEKISAGALAICLSLLSVTAHGQDALNPQAQVRGGLTAVLAQVPAETNVGLVVVDTATGRPWFEQLPDTPLKPASVMKLLVTAAALEHLGADFTYTTRLFLRGDELWVLGTGDPSLGDSRLNERAGRAAIYPFDTWVQALRRANVQTLNKIVLDDAVFDRQWRHPDWPADQAARWYQAPVGGLNFNDNCVDARAEIQDGQVLLKLHPRLPANFYTNKLRIGRQHKPVALRQPDQDFFEFSGSIKRACTLAPVSARRPTVFFGHALRETLLANGIDVQAGVVRRSLTPADFTPATLVIARCSTPLKDILWRCNTFSQNLFAECLLKTLATHAPGGQPNGQTGSWTAGTSQVRHTLESLGVDLNHAVLCDGSGLSHDNRVTARQITQLLVCMYNQPHRDIFINSLAVPGQDGSMRQRYADPLLRNCLRGKTGSISGVSSLAGYLTRPDGTVLAFALLCNGPSNAKLPVRIGRVLAGAEADPPK
ncbi:MAG: D-alanyl-D-alanine carboxypeptidase/D-alanyl-D-alanine-endopeptidase [Planctomycetota bacterium]